MTKKPKRIPLAEQLTFPEQRDQIMSAIRSERITTPVKQSAARRYAELRGISYKSALRTIDRYTTTTAAQKRGVKRPNADIVQSISDAQSSVGEANGERMEIVIDPPESGDIHEWVILSDHDHFASAVRVAERIAGTYRHTGSNPHLWRVIVSRGGLLQESSFGGEYFLIPRTSGYEISETYWVERI